MVNPLDALLGWLRVGLAAFLGAKINGQGKVRDIWSPKVKGKDEVDKPGFGKIAAGLVTVYFWQRTKG